MRTIILELIHRRHLDRSLAPDKHSMRINYCHNRFGKRMVRRRKQGIARKTKTNRIAVLTGYLEKRKESC